MIVLGIFCFSYRGWKSWGGGESIVFLCLGPSLIFGFASILSASLLLETTIALFPVPLLFWLITLGIFSGWLAVLCWQMNSWKNIVGDKELSLQTIMSRIGFDTSRYLIYFHLVGLSVFFGFLSSMFVGGLSWILGLSFCIISLGLLAFIQRIRTPFSLVLVHGESLLAAYPFFSLIVWTLMLLNL